MKDKILERRIKIGVTLLFLFVVVISTGISTLVITDKQITFGNTIEILDSSISIQGVIDSIVDASETNQYEIILYPGIYTENIVLKDWVFISGITNSHDIILQANTGKLITWDSTGCNDGNSSGINNLRLTSTPTNSDVEIINISAGNHVIFDCYIDVYPTSTSMTVMNISEGNVTVSNCNFLFKQTGNATGVNNQRCIIVRGNGSIDIITLSIEMNIEDYDDSAVCIGVLSSAISEVCVQDSSFHMTSTNQTSFNGTWQCISVDSNTTNTNIQSNHIHLNCTSSAIFSTGNAYCYKSYTGTGAEIHSTCNRIIIEGFPFSYFAYVNKPNYVISHFDDVVAIEKIWGTGNVTAVYSDADGELHLNEIHLIDELHVDKTSVLSTGIIDTIFDIVIDLGDSTGGDIHVIDVALTQNVTLANISIIGAHSGVDVIHQEVGVDAFLGKAWTYNSVVGYTDVSNAFNTSGTDVTLFGSDNDYVYIGSSSMFDNIIVTLDTVASATIFQVNPIWEYSTGGAVWQSFTPGDDTNGFQQSGFIRFGRGTLSDWATENVNAGGAFYYIRFQRTRNYLATTPIEDRIQLESTVSGDYSWNSDGNITVNNVRQTVSSGALTDGAPTTAEITGILGFGPTDVGAGWTTYILDTDGTVHMYQIVSDGTAEWYYVEMADAN